MNRPSDLAEQVGRRWLELHMPPFASTEDALDKWMDGLAQGKCMVVIRRDSEVRMITTDRLNLYQPE